MKFVERMNFLQRCILPADCSRITDTTQDDYYDAAAEDRLRLQLARSLTQDLSGDFLKIRREVEQRVKYMLSEHLLDEDHLSCFADIIKMMSMCGDFGEGHIMFLDTLWSRSREIIHARRRSEQHLCNDAQAIHLDLETEALYQEMRRDLMDLVKERGHRNLLQHEAASVTDANTSSSSGLDANGNNKRTELSTSCGLNLDAT